MALVTESFQIYQANPAAATAADLLPAIAASTKTFVRTLKACNTGGTAANIRVWVVKSGDGDALTKQYLLFDYRLVANASYSDPDGFPLPTGAKIRCQASTANVAFSVFVDEVT